MNLPIISNEQNNIINLLKDNKNIIVDSVAGSGKTTTNLYIAKSFPKLNILLLTYNAKLKIETRERIDKLEITNLETHSYHSFCVKYYNNKCYTDYEIKNIINSNLKTLKQISYDILILDEAQDITDLYYELICKIFTDNNKKAQICLLGDRYQSIYDFNNADPRFIIYAEQIFNFNNLFWNKCQLSQSYRITKEMAEFINICLINSNRIRSEKITNNKPTYIICNTFCDTIDSLPFIEIKKYFELGYKPDEIFILAPSIKNKNAPIRIFENLIKDKLKDIPVFVPNSDDEKLDKDILKNKLVFSTFHQSKGLERKVVIIFGFDDSYFKFFKKDNNPAFCPNEIYVATTRASEHLILLHHKDHNFFQFLNQTKLKELCNCVFNKLIIKKIKTDNYNTSVTDLLKHLPIEILNNCISYLKIENINKESNLINIPVKINDKYGHENVSEITGTAIPAYFQYKKNNKMTILDEISKENLLYNDPIYDLNNIHLENIKENELLYISNLYCSFRSGFKFKTYQITNYDWLSCENLKLAIDRLNKLNISNNAEFEIGYEAENKELEPKPELRDRRLIGFIDCIDGNNIYEFKCVKKLENEHILQLAIYMYLHELEIRKNKKNNTFEKILEKYKDELNKNNIKISKLKMKKKINDLQSDNEAINITPLEI
jgi:DNA polymerase III delta prime subunit